MMESRNPAFIKSVTSDGAKLINMLPRICKENIKYRSILSVFQMYVTTSEWRIGKRKVTSNSNSQVN